MNREILDFSKSLLIVGFLFLSISYTYGQSKEIEINWENPINYGLEGAQNYKALNFEKAHFDFNTDNLPYYYQQLETKGNYKPSLSITEEEWIDLTEEERSIIDLQLFADTFGLTIEHSIIKKAHTYFLRFRPFKLVNGQPKKLKRLKMTQTNSAIPSAFQRRKSRSYADNSVLSNGDWYKIGVTTSGVFKLNYAFLNNLGINPSDIDPRNIRIYGNGGGMLPAKNSAIRYDDLVENPIQVVGENDGSFNSGDYILFYAYGPVRWVYDTTNQMFVHRSNFYSDTAYYFLNVDLGRGKRIQKVENPQGASIIATTFDDYQYHEVDQVNLLKSGQRWYGETFDNVTSKNFSFEFPDIDLNSSGRAKVSAIARSGVASTYNFTIGSSSSSVSIISTILTRYDVDFARTGTRFFDFNPVGEVNTLNVSYNKPASTSKGWLDYIDINVRRQLNFSNGQMPFRDGNTTNQGLVEFRFTGSGNPRVWDITNVETINEKTIVQNGNFRSFVDDNTNLKEFVAFNSFDSLNVFPLKRVPNQNLHAVGPQDLIIVSHPNFIIEANELAQIHESEGLRVAVFTPEQVYNEFSSGSQDPVAIRSLMKMLYDRATNVTDLPKYLLIVGDASYDFKDRISGNSNYVVSYQSPNSLDPVSSYISDDYMGLLDDEEGEWKFSTINPDKLDVSVGRLPVRSRSEAQGIISKIRAYLDPNNRGDWQNKIVFVGDDGDGVTHMSQSNQLAGVVERNHKEYNLNKIFLDAYQRISTAAGLRYPEVNEDIRRSVQNGALIVNYTGHGGETGWTAERVLDIATINGWTNNKNLPLFVTATCEFSRFDDPLRTSAGELVLLNPNGGGIGLFTTTRLVYSSPNYYLNQTFYNNIFDRNADGETYRVGDIMTITKNANATQGNTRNFSLLGDPALKIAIPNYQIVTTKINDQDVSLEDTLTALSKVKMEGEVRDLNGNLLSDFNGIIYPTVFDKEVRRLTLNNTGGGAYPYTERSNVLFNGKVTARNGLFSFEFIIPKDINYQYGKGKISYFGQSNTRDANGYNESFYIGGSSNQAISDQEGPELEIYMNDESFIYGGMTNSNPLLIAKLFDEQGINTVGNGIGHDLIAVIDGNTENAINLNEYFESAIDDYKKGEIRFPMSDLSDGKHTLSLKAWDNANNSSEKTIEFNVVSERNVKIENLVNYPNPFTTNTEFIFQHNQPGTAMDVKLDIFTVSGKLVKSFNEVIINDGFLSRDIRWNGRDDYGDRIGKGVYVYKLKVRSRNGSVDEVIEKLVIL